MSMDDGWNRTTILNNEVLSYPAEREPFGRLLARIESRAVRLAHDGTLHPEEMALLNAELAPHELEIAGFSLATHAISFRPRK